MSYFYKAQDLNWHNGNMNSPRFILQLYKEFLISKSYKGQSKRNQKNSH